MNRPSVLAISGVAAAVVIGLVIGVVLAVRSVTADGGPGAPGPTPTGPGGTSSTGLPSPGPQDSYWTPERMHSAQPAPMPSE